MSDLSNIKRLTGMASGLDTESMVKQLMSVERMPLNKLNQKKQILEWKKDAYRDITNILRGFRDDFFSVLKPGANMLSSSIYYKYAATSTKSDTVTATAGPDARPGTHTIKVTQMAASANVSSSADTTKALTGSVPAGLDFTDGNNLINITLDGLTKTIGLKTDAAYTDVNDLITNGTFGLQKLVNDAFGAGKITVTADGSGVLTLSSADTSKITLNSLSSNSGLEKLGFSNNASNRLNTAETLENLASKFNVPLTFDADNELKFNINGVDFKFSKTTTLKDMMNQVNNSGAGVELKYSELTDEFTVTAKRTGAGANIIISNTGGNFFDANEANSAARIATGIINNGVDAIFDLDGEIGITRSDNSVTIDGITYVFNKEDPAAEIKITVSQDVDSSFNAIKSFVEKYNEMLEKLNSKLIEPKFREYQPLTDEQKEELKEDEIKKWEEKAQSGLLRNDPIIQKIVADMRKALSSAIKDIAGNLSDIGITTGTYEKRGQLFIDEFKLKDAIRKQPDKVKDLFIKTSSVGYSPNLTTEQRNQRFNEAGIVQRLQDIITDNIRLSRNSNGKKGILIEKAGLAGDVSEFINTIDKDLTKTVKQIDEMNKKLFKKEETYYRKFAALEKAISKMNMQNSWLQQEFASN